MACCAAADCAADGCACCGAAAAGGWYAGAAPPPPPPPASRAAIARACSMACCAAAVCAALGCSCCGAAAPRKLAAGRGLRIHIGCCVTGTGGGGTDAAGRKFLGSTISGRAPTSPAPQGAAATNAERRSEQQGCVVVARRAPKGDMQQQHPVWGATLPGRATPTTPARPHPAVCRTTQNRSAATGCTPPSLQH